MTVLKRTFIGLTTALLLTLAAGPARADFKSDLRAALEIHDKATNVTEQAKALEAFQKVSTQYPDQWLGHFWTAYEETQIAMLSKRQNQEGDFSAHLDRAQTHLTQLEALNSSATARQRSSLAELQALIYGFRAWFDPAKAKEWKDKAKAATDRGALLDRYNPVVMVRVGTDLVRRGQGEKDPALLLAACQLLRLAQGELDQIADRSRTTYFNSEWIQFWLPGAEKALAALDGQ